MPHGHRESFFFTGAECIGIAVDSYPFKRGESDKIRLELDKDFYFRGTGSKFIYVMFGQLKNSLYLIYSALKGDISIVLKPCKGANMIVFRDELKGI